MFYDRWDFLATKVLLAGVAVGAPVVTLALPVLDWARGRALTWELASDGLTVRQTGAPLRDGVTAGPVDTVVLAIREAGAAAWLASLLPGLVLSVATVLVVVMLLRLMKRIQAGSPFVSASAGALRMIGVTVLVAAPLESVARGVADAVVARHSLVGSFDFSLTLPLLPMLAALLVLALSEAFGQGVRMQHDVEGLV